MSQRTGVSLRSLRYYEEKKLLQPTRLENGYREYLESDIEKVEFIQLYFSLGLTAKELMDFFECVFQNETKRECLPNAIDVGERKLGEIQKRIQTLRRAESLLEEKLSRWRDLMNRTEERE